MSDTDWEPDPVIPGFLQNAMNEADAAHFDEDEQPEVIDAADEESDRFDKDVEQDVLGLLNLGRLTRRFEIMGHSFVLRTLTVGEELAIWQVVNEFAGTIGQGKAFQTAVVAAAIVTVDSRELVAPLGPDTQAGLQDKFDYVTRNWYMRTIDEVFAAYQDLLLRQQRAYDALLVKSKASPTTY